MHHISAAPYSAFPENAASRQHHLAIIGQFIIILVSEYLRTHIRAQVDVLSINSRGILFFSTFFSPPYGHEEPPSQPTLSSVNCQRGSCYSLLASNRPQMQKHCQYKLYYQTTTSHFWCCVCVKERKKSQVNSNHFLASSPFFAENNSSHIQPDDHHHHLHCIQSDVAGKGRRRGIS